LNSSPQGQEWLGEFAKDFRRRFLSLLSFKFREFGCVTALSMLEAINVGVKPLDDDPSKSQKLDANELAYLLTPFDLKRLESYGNNLLDYHVILDLMPTAATLFFENRLDGDEEDAVHLGAVQSAILLGLGLQRKEIEDIEKELNLPVSQTLALFGKVVRKISKRLVNVQKAAISAEIPVASTSSQPLASANQREREPITATIEQELNEAGERETSQQKQRQREMIDSLDLTKYSINDAAVDWSLAEKQIQGSGKVNTIVSVKSAGTKRKASDVEEKRTGDAGGREKKTRRGMKTKR